MYVRMYNTDYMTKLHTAELRLVLTMLGAIQLTLMFSAPSSTDRVLVKPNKAVLLTE